MYKSFYNILNLSLCLKSQEREIIDFCDYMWQDFLCFHSSKADFEFTVVPCIGERGVFIIYKGESVAFEWGKVLSDVPLANITKVLENIVSGHAINQVDKREMITLHSGAVSRDNKGILILGESGNGKSTLTLELVANQNWLYLTDEVGLLDTNQVIHPFLKTVSYKRECVVKIDEKWEFRQFGIDHQVAVPKDKHGTAVPLRAIFFVKYSPDVVPCITPINKSESLIRLLDSQIGREKSVATLEQMAEVVKNVNSYQVFHNNASEAGLLVTKLVDSL